ncbi:MAG: 5-formyltetrahydrofolate cyclo-ligase [Nitrososphaerales archaeon]|nr:5-formyltetrahydrofolate cyclo-ligase [Nitrososphaerales archaeon]
MSKTDLRQAALKSRRSLTSQSIETLSAEVERVLLQLPEFMEARTVATYVAKSDEVQTAGIIDAALARKKRVLVPRAGPASLELSFFEIHSLSELSPGSFGVLEPGKGAQGFPLSDSEIVLVPIVAWDEKGHRLGYGKGYFDKALRSRGTALAAGLALESQRFPAVPQGPSDSPLDVIVTERRIVRVEARDR